jgi:7-cyano-7-deazaguanine synthase
MVVKQIVSFVLVSGGPDSTTLAYWLKNQKVPFEAIYVNYGQSTWIQELRAAKFILAQLEAKLHIIDLQSTMQTFRGRQIDSIRRKKRTCVDECVNYYSGALFVAACIVEAGGKTVYAGLHADDVERFREVLNAVQKISHSISDFMFRQFSYQYPFIDKTQPEVFKLGYQLGIPFQRTWSCSSAAVRKYDIHCGTCDGCNSRKKSFKQARITDRTYYIG